MPSENVTNVYFVIQGGKMAKLTEVVSVRITKEMFEAMCREARGRGLKPCDIARWALIRYFDFEEADNVPTRVQQRAEK